MSATTTKLKGHLARGVVNTTKLYLRPVYYGSVYLCSATLLSLQLLLTGSVGTHTLQARPMTNAANLYVLWIYIES